MAEETAPPRNNLKTARILAWVLVALAVVGVAALWLLPRAQTDSPAVQQAPSVQARFGGPFTLVGADGKPFSSQSLEGKPYAMYFGFTRCGDVCPTTLARLVKLRKQAGGEQAFNIVFVTIDPANDGPKEVGQYASLFNSPIIGLTGSKVQIDQVKKQFGIYAEPEHMSGSGHEMQMNHTATVLLFGRDGNFDGTIAPDEPDGAALAKVKRIAA